MNVLKSINVFRRNLMRRITKNIGRSHLHVNEDLSEKIEIKRVLICRPNHRLGNLLLITPLLQEVTATFPGCKIDLFVKGGLAPILFKNYKNIDYIIQLPKKPFSNLFQYIKGWIDLKRKKYDIVINASRRSSSGRLSAQLANSKIKFFGDTCDDFQPKGKDQQHMAKYPIYSLRHYLSKLGFLKRNKKIAPLCLKLSESEIDEGQKKLKELVNNDKKTICLFTYATGHKCYSRCWWQPFYERLKKEYPDYNIVEVLPIENISMIEFQAPSFYSKDIREIGSFIANTTVFIGADSGIMHLASAAGTPTIGLFSVTNENAYKPYGNNSVAINTNTTTIDECIEIVEKVLSVGFTK
jgi:ADP-heptose:LPS heptosyltransferase